MTGSNWMVLLCWVVCFPKTFSHKGRAVALGFTGFYLHLKFPRVVALFHKYTVLQLSSLEIGKPGQRVSYKVLWPWKCEEEMV